MDLIFIPRLTKKHLLFLGFSISSFFREFMSLINPSNDEKEKEVPKRYFDILENVFSDLLQGILFLLETIRRKKESSKLKNKRINSSEADLNNKDKNTTKFGIIPILSIISALDFYCQLMFLIFVLVFNKDNVIKRYYQDFVLIIDITSRFLFCRYILKTYFYRHHIASMIVNIGAFLVICFLDIKHIIQFDNEKPEIIIIFGIVLVIQTVAYSLEDVLNKIALTRDNITPYSLLFYKGLFQVPFVIILTFFILMYEDNEKNNVFQIFLNSPIKEFISIKRSIFIFCNIIRSICLVQVIDSFSSQYLSILKVLESLLFFIYFLIDDIFDQKQEIFSLYDTIILFILFIILVLTSLVYNEIVVLNIFGLQDYTQHGLDVLAEKDLRDAITETSEITSEQSSDSPSCTQSVITQNVSFND